MNMASLTVPVVRDTPRDQPGRHTSISGLLRRTKSADNRSKKKKQDDAQKQAQERELRRNFELRVPHSQPSPTNSHVHRDHNALSSIHTAARFPKTFEDVPLIVVPNEKINVPLAKLSSASTNDWAHPLARNEIKATNEKNSSSSGNAPRPICPAQRVRKRKGPAPFKYVLILGSKSCGKTSFLNFLKASFSSQTKKKAQKLTNLREDIFAPPYHKFGSFEKHYIEAEIDRERLGLTLWDSEGLEENIIDFQLQEILNFIESKFEETFNEEIKVIRTPGGVQDNHIHVIFLLLDPLRLDRNIAAFKSARSQESWLIGKNDYTDLDVIGGLDKNLELKVLQTLQGKAIVVPIISKADTITTTHMSFLKTNIRESLRNSNLDQLDLFGLDDADVEPSKGSSNTAVRKDTKSDKYISSPEKNVTTESQNRLPPNTHESARYARCKSIESENNSDISAFPLSIISPDINEPNIVGRQFPWGFADPFNGKHCDFLCLKNTIFGEWRADLREVCLEVLYENWRTNRLKQQVQ
ncbi:Septin-7 [Golovinomyces cichoracearum]|uniref:Septin-7 n=1 Tax=Golovinomyces cichoracearum TaxID=62708 RepID=A0A420J8H5_9PEZI|nr:Septin-7 [Golovinomyces cichoracearum]